MMEKRVGGFLEGAGSKVVGYAAVFGPLSEDLGGFRERIDPAAFDFSIKQNVDVRALVDHESGKVLGRRSNGTLQIATDKTGLRVEIDLPETSYANDLKALMARGDISQMSFAFTVPPNGDSWDGTTEDGLRLRTLKDVRLVEVSVVAIPAYPDTTAALRKLHAINGTLAMRHRAMVALAVRYPLAWQKPI